MKRLVGQIIFLAVVGTMLCVFAEEAETFTSGDYIYMLNEDGSAVIGKYSGNDNELTIPSELDGHPVRKIDWTFYSCDSLTSVTIPNSVTTIGDLAFAYCYSLTSVTIPNSVTSIGDHAFYACTSLTSVTIPDSVTTIGNRAFNECTSLTSVTIPDSVTSIGSEMFSYCTSLTSVTIPDSVTSIGSEMFSYCTSLTSVTIPDSVTSIGRQAFSGCSNLISVTIPDSVTSIGWQAFSGCSNLSLLQPDFCYNSGQCDEYRQRGILRLQEASYSQDSGQWGNRHRQRCFRGMPLPDSHRQRVQLCRILLYF